MNKLEESILREFIIVVDTNETLAYKFKGQMITHASLDTGDYSVKGFENDITIERKTHGDFLGSITHGRKRFVAELKRMQSFKIKAVVIECDYSHLANGSYAYSKVDPNSVVGTIAKIITDFGIPVVPAQNRQRAEDFTLRMLRRGFMVMRGLR